MYIVKKVAEDIKYTKIQEFIKKSSDIERVQFVIHSIAQYEDFQPLFDNDKKDSSLSTAFRNAGNSVFVSSYSQDTEELTEEAFLKACKMYTKCIAYAPLHSKEYALGFSNRSAALFYLKKYRECVKDIDVALELPHLDDLKIKLYLRKIESLSKIRSDKLDETCIICRNFIEQTNLHPATKKAYQQKLHKAYYSVMESEFTENIKSRINLRDLMQEVFYKKRRNQGVNVSIFDIITMKYTNTYGRYVLAKRDIEPGEVIMLKKPYMTVLSEQDIYTHCSACLEESWNLIPCSYCVNVMYCSEECRTIAWMKYHNIECNIMASVNALGLGANAYMVLRPLIMAVYETGSLERLQQQVADIEMRLDYLQANPSEELILHDDKYASFYNLISSSNKIPAESAIYKAVIAASLVYMLATKTTFYGQQLRGDWNLLSHNPNVVFTANLIYRHYRAIRCFLNDKDNGNRTPVLNGSLIVPFMNLFKHSCFPNVRYVTIKGGLVMYATSLIKAEEEMFIQYQDIDCRYMNKTQRQELLTWRHHIFYKCKPCIENWPLIVNAPSIFTDQVVASSDLMRKRIINLITQYRDESPTFGYPEDLPIIMKKLSTIIVLLMKHISMPNKQMYEAVALLNRVYFKSAHWF